MSKLNDDRVITESDRCIGDWYGVRCSLSSRWFVKTVDGFYRCQECKSIYKKLDDGSYELIK